MSTAEAANSANVGAAISAHTEAQVTASPEVPESRAGENGAVPAGPGVRGRQGAARAAGPRSRAPRAGPAAPDPGAGQPAAGPAGPGAAQAPRVRPLRKDAERNRVRILAAAAEVFTEQGLQATLDDVAARAGVGVGTVYRRFPDKEAIFEELFTERLGTMVGFAEQALAEPDPWQGLVLFFERAGGLIAVDRGLRQILMYATYGHDRVERARSRMLPLVDQMIQRAQTAGAIRADLRPTDVPAIVFTLGMLADYVGGVRLGVWRRYLALILDALRPERAGTTVLPEPALSPDEMVQVMRTGWPRGG